MCNLKYKQILWRSKYLECLPVSIQSRHALFQEAINFYKDETDQSEKYLKMELAFNSVAVARWAHMDIESVYLPERG